MAGRCCPIELQLDAQAFFGAPEKIFIACVAARIRFSATALLALDPNKHLTSILTKSELLHEEDLVAQLMKKQLPELAKVALVVRLACVCLCSRLVPTVLLLRVYVTTPSLVLPENNRSFEPVLIKVTTERRIMIFDRRRQTHRRLLGCLIRQVSDQPTTTTRVHRTTSECLRVNNSTRNATSFCDSLSLLLTSPSWLTTLPAPHEHCDAAGDVIRMKLMLIDLPDGYLNDTAKSDRKASHHLGRRICRELFACLFVA